MQNIGDLFGRITLASVIYLSLRLILVWVIAAIRKQDNPVPDWLKKVSQFMYKTHKYVGFFAAGLVIMHAISQIQYYENIPPIGLLAGLFLVIQAVLGYLMIGLKDKERRAKLVMWHRWIGGLIVFAVLAHRISGSIRDPRPK